MTEEYYQDEELNEAEENSPELYERHRFVADKGQGALRVDRFLSNMLGNSVSRTRIQEAAQAGYIKVNHCSVKSNHKIKPLDVVTVSLDYPQDDFTVFAENIPVNIAYEDDDILLIDKQPGLCVHPAVGNRSGTLLNALAYYFRDSANFDANNPKIGLVHRIDKDTSGLLLIAKTEFAKSNLGQQFFDKTTERTYNALVWGVVKEDSGTITGNIARDTKDRQSFRIYTEEENPAAKYAITHYRVLQRFEYVTLVECKLETGRTHQIRVHFQSIGHSLFNDAKYGGAEIVKGNLFAKYKQFVLNCFEVCPRQALHAKTLGFIHPTKQEWMQFDSELPEDFQALLEKWKNYSKG
ncbi:MAG: RluA family pseudouridine synthase [Prevotellaceae bacterium]|jgi:23S rRNA pseudouridine1911/1915/1917 synthase|nr:RluA family pseudouridine synthase [Prevotellaceae bacterium]